MTKNKRRLFGILMAVVMLLNIPLHSSFIGANQLSSPHFAWVSNTQIEFAQAGDEFVVELEMEFLTTHGWNALELLVHYDNEKLELLPFEYAWGYPNWVGTNPNNPPWTVISFPGHPGHGGEGNIFMSIQTSRTTPIPFSPSLFFRFRVLDDAPSGITTISWTPLLAASWENGQFSLLTVVPPTNNCFVHVLINPVGSEWVNAPGVGWVFYVAGNRHMGWLVWEGSRFFMNPANGGTMVTSPTMYINGEFHTFDSTGRWQGKLGHIDGDWVNVPGVGWVFYVEATGSRHFGWLMWEGQVFRMSPAMVSNTTVLIDGVWHQFNSAGLWLGSL